MLKTKLTKRKFYNKWLYKISIFCPGATIYRIKSYKECLDWLDHQAANKIYPPFHYYTKALKNIYFKQITAFLNNLDTKIYFKRIEGNTLDFYTNDINLYQNALNEFEEIVINCYEPDITLLDILTLGNVILANKLPHNKYNYKVFLLPHVFHKDLDCKKKYLKWLDTQKDKIHITEKVKKWFIDQNYNWDRRYMYVEDAKTLFLVRMRNQDVIGRIYEYVIVDK